MRARVLQVVLSLNAGGTERLVVELVKGLHSEVPMAVCCLDDKGVWASELESRRVIVRALGRHSGFRPALGRSVAALAREHAANVIHCHHYSPFIYGCLSLLWRPRSRVVFTEHGRLSDARPSRKRRMVNQLFAHVPRAVFAVSGDLRQHLLDEGFPSRTVAVIHNGIDVGPRPSASMRAEVRRRLDVRDDSILVIGTVARLDPVKDLATLIRAVSDLSRHLPAMLVVVGDGPERGALEALARDLGSADLVRFLGQRDDAREWLSGCDVYVNSSISEGVSLTILEAMAAALPVIATRVGGTPEVVDDSCGRLVPPRQPQELVKSIQELAGDGLLRARLGDTARRRVETRFSLDRMLRQYRDVYSRLA
jgi:glycosyltransferase involved in cell wall biosynthesis